MIIQTNLDIDFGQRGSSQQLYVVQGDCMSRSISFSLYENEMPWQIPTDVTPALYYRKSDGTGGVYDTLPDGVPAWKVPLTQEGNRIDMILAPQVMTAPGLVQCHLMLVKGESILRSFSFRIIVEPAPAFDAEQSEEYSSWSAAFLPQTIGADIGQYLEISDVDALGRVKKLRAVDSPIGKDGKSAYAYALEGGYTGTEEEFAEKLASGSGYPAPCVMDYGAIGDGVADDTAAFQSALDENRVVFVPGGTYKLSGTLLIRENCCLELSQDTLLQFTQTDKNCIDMRRSANLRGNHATIFVPYTFGANVIHASTDVEDGNATDVPPWTAWDPQWKMTRYITDINICKPNSWSGRCNSLDGAVYGTAVDIYCERDTYNSIGDGLEQSFMWGVDMSGLRIAGGFVYGLRMHNKDTAWNHDSRIEAVIYGCETAVSIENCHFVHLAASIQPAPAQQIVDGSVVETAYAKNGIKLVDSHNIDLTQSFVWDWQHARKDSPEYTHIAMYGSCYGVVLNEPRYYESSVDVRKSIFTDTPDNLDKMTVLQEPITRWFKPIEGRPYFSDGQSDIPLMARDEIQEYFVTDRVANFTDVLATAKDTDKTTVYNGIGYKKNARVIMASGAVLEDANSAYYVATGFIPIKAGDILYTSGVHFDSLEGASGMVYYDENLNRIWSATSHVLMVNGPGYTSGYYQKGERTEDGVKITTSTNLAEKGTVAYVRFNFYIYDFSDHAAISVNNEIKWEQAGFLADGIKIKAENVIGNTGGGSGGTCSWNDLTDKPFDVVELMPTTQFQYNENFGFFMAMSEFELTPGRTYMIEWNGVEYTDTARAIIATFGENTACVVFVGNAAAAGGENNGMPFAFARILFDSASKGSVIAIPLDGSPEVSVRIRSSTLYDMSDTLVLDTRYDMTTGKLTAVYATPEQIRNAVYAGKRVVAIAMSSQIITQMRLDGFWDPETTGAYEYMCQFSVPTWIGDNKIMMKYNGDGTYVPYNDTE